MWSIKGKVLKSKSIQIITSLIVFSRNDYGNSHSVMRSFYSLEVSSLEFLIFSVNVTNCTNQYGLMVLTKP